MAQAAARLAVERIWSWALSGREATRGEELMVALRSELDAEIHVEGDVATLESAGAATAPVQH